MEQERFLENTAHLTLEVAASTTGPSSIKVNVIKVVLISLKHAVKYSIHKRLLQTPDTKDLWLISFRPGRTKHYTCPRLFRLISTDKIIQYAGLVGYGKTQRRQHFLQNILIKPKKDQLLI